MKIPSEKLNELGLKGKAKVNITIPEIQNKGSFRIKKAMISSLDISSSCPSDSLVVGVIMGAENF